MYYHFNCNPQGKAVGDCAVRALCKALDMSWNDVHIDLCSLSRRMADMPSSNAVIGEYLRLNGFSQRLIPNQCPSCTSVYDFAKEHPKGTYVLFLPNHVVCVQDGRLYDTWNSSNETILYYFEKEAA